MNVVQIKRRANTAVHLAVLGGVLTRPEVCEDCGRNCKPQGAHYDYARPLDVRWLCPRCHVRWDRAEPKTHTAVAIAEPRLPIKVSESYARPLRLREVARLFDVHPNTVRGWAEAGLIPSIKTLGGHYRIPVEAVEAITQPLTSKPTIA